MTSERHYGISICINGVTSGGSVIEFKKLEDAEAYERKLKERVKREVAQRHDVMEVTK